MKHPRTAAEFEWDEGNLPKLARRGVRPEDVEHVFWNRPRWIPNKKAATAEWLMDGYDTGGRRLRVGVLWVDQAEGVLVPSPHAR